jgi:hypothetical protein
VVRTVVLVGVVVVAAGYMLLVVGLMRTREATRPRGHPDAVLAAGRPSDPRGRNPRGSAAEPAPATPGALVAARAPGAPGPRKWSEPRRGPREPTAHVGRQSTASAEGVPAVNPAAPNRRGLGNDGFSRFAGSGRNVRATKSLNRA